jgi:ribosome-binding factor A
MPRRYSRSARVGDLIQIELAKIVQREIQDNHLGLVTITQVDISPDFSHARVFVSTIPEERAAELIIVLNKSARHLRFELAKSVKLRVMPELKFFYDDTAVNGQRISTLLNKVFNEDNSSSDE